MTSVLPAVRAGYSVGLCLLPVCEDGSKAPDVSSWTAFMTTRPTAAIMRCLALREPRGVRRDRWRGQRGP